MRALELYSGIGGFAAAASGIGISVCAALDASSHVVEAYNANFEPVASQRNLLSLSVDDFASFQADLWWMSPPCAPYTRRGNKRDLKDHRAESFLVVIDALRTVRPPAVALENVEGFAESQARDVLLETLRGYEVREWVLCPTELGVPNKRPRYYLVASRDGLRDVAQPAVDSELADWRGYLDGGEETATMESYRVPDRIVEKYGDGFHVVDESDDSESYTTCFTGAYGKSWNFTGSYLRLPDGGLRQFTPAEVLRFLHFPDDFGFPAEFGRRQQWKYAGNSLSVAAVQHVLEGLTTSRPDPQIL